MKTKKTTKTRQAAKQVKELIKLGLFFAVPILFVIIAIVSRNNSFNAF